ncbi:MAG: hypothetical protein WA864_28640 [Acetobacteraceae bacterium]
MLSSALPQARFACTLGAYGAAATNGKVANVFEVASGVTRILGRVGLFWTTLIISIRGLSLSAVPGVVNSYTSCAGLLGNVFAPTGGVLIADYLAMKRARIDELAWHLAER